MSLIPRYKVGDCSRCGAANVACKKRGKNLLCLNCCDSDDRKVATTKATNKINQQKVRMLTVSNPGSAIITPDDKLIDNEAARKFKRLLELKQWFLDVREKLTGFCQCGCGNKSQKNDDKYFRHSCCHIFPKSKFPSVATHPLNYVERSFWGGCHSVLDDTSMDRWVNMADWQDIRQKFMILAPLLTKEERCSKFYTHLNTLVLEN